MSDDTDTYPRATPFTQEQLRSAYAAYAPEVVLCKNGHELTGDNVSHQKDGSGRWIQVCRQCNKDRAKRWRQINEHRLERKAGGTGKTLRRDVRTE